MADTIRERILKAIVAKLKNMRAGEPTGDPYTITWSSVSRGPLPVFTKGKTAVVSVQDGEEAKTWKVGFAYPSLTITIHFSLYVPTDDEASERANAALGDIQRAMREDISFGGLAIAVEEQKNDVYIFDDDARHVEGALIYEVQYRHRENDPRSLS